uniref:Uncharacterized protein n=1 Tax=Opuntia streptacantha TaxID=393608 RepID=A0A7C9A5B9_OPUST
MKTFKAWLPLWWAEISSFDRAIIWAWPAIIAFHVTKLLVSISSNNLCAASTNPHFRYRYIIEFVISRFPWKPSLMLKECVCLPTSKACSPQHKLKMVVNVNSLSSTSSESISIKYLRPISGSPLSLQAEITAVHDITSLSPILRKASTAKPKLLHLE